MSQEPGTGEPKTYKGTTKKSLLDMGIEETKTIIRPLLKSGIEENQVSGLTISTP